MSFSYNEHFGFINLSTSNVIQTQNTLKYCALTVEFQSKKFNKVRQTREVHRA